MTERYDDRLNAELRRMHPLGRVGVGEDVSSVVSFLPSPEANFVTADWQ